jgi:hypothetical protein
MQSNTPVCSEKLKILGTALIYLWFRWWNIFKMWHQEKEFKQYYKHWLKSKYNGTKQINVKTKKKWWIKQVLKRFVF